MRINPDAAGLRTERSPILKASANQWDPQIEGSRAKGTGARNEDTRSPDTTAEAGPPQWEVHGGDKNKQEAPSGTQGSEKSTGTQGPDTGARG